MKDERLWNNRKVYTTVYLQSLAAVFYAKGVNGCLLFDEHINIVPGLVAIQEIP